LTIQKNLGEFLALDCSQELKKIIEENKGFMDLESCEIKHDTFCITKERKSELRIFLKDSSGEDTVFYTIASAKLKQKQNNYIVYPVIVYTDTTITTS